MSSDETSELISFGGGVGENFLTRNLVVSHEPRLPKKDSAVRVERVLCFHFTCLDHPFDTPNTKNQTSGQHLYF